MDKPGHKYYYSFILMAFILLSCCRASIAQDILIAHDYCETAKQLNLESENIRNSDRQLALEKAEQALVLAQKHACGSMEALAHRNIGIIYFFKGSYPEAEDSFSKALQIYSSIADSLGVSNVLNNMAFVFIKTGQYKKAHDFLSRAQHMFIILGDSIGEAKTWLNLMQVYFYQGMFAEALASIRKALAIHEERGDVSNILLCQNNLAAIYETQGLYDEALDIFEQALQTSIDLEDDASRSMILNNMGMIHYELEEYQNAIDLYTNSLLLKVELDDKAGISLCLSNLGSTLRMLGRIDESNAHFTQALKIDQDLGNQLGIAIQLAQIAGNLLHKNEPLNAISYYQQSNEIAYDINARHLLKENFMYLVKAYIAANNYDQAYDYMVKYITFRDDMIIPPEELEGYGYERKEPGKVSRFFRTPGCFGFFDLVLVLSILLNLFLLFRIMRKH
ncbi:MAG: tetratricopeptide repeat protein [Bacteroidales bacterium]|nr:tetratricopeptide repeat protein [Bacteroidales bacterium]